MTKPITINDITPPAPPVVEEVVLDDFPDPPLADLNFWGVSDWTIKLPRVTDAYHKGQLELRIAEERAAGKLPTDLVPVSRDSPRPLRRAAEALGVFFRREFGYDFRPYSADCREADVLTYLWEVPARDCLRGDASLMVGAVGFDRREWVDDFDGWTLGWAWLHPYARRRGMLTEAWPFFRRRFGDFRVLHPLSHAMAAFLKKRGEEPITRRGRQTPEEPP